MTGNNSVKLKKGTGNYLFRSQMMIHIDSNDIDEKKLEQKIEKSIKTNQPVSFDTVIAHWEAIEDSVSLLKNNIIWLKSNWQLKEIPIEAKKNFLKKFFVLLKKVLRKCMRWYVSMYIEQQNRINQKILNSLQTTEQIQELILTELKRMENEHEN